MDPFDTPKNKILHISFNQDQDCFAVGTETGFYIFESNPVQELFYRDFGAGIGIIAMLHKSNILVLVGGGSHPKYPANKVILWDEGQKKPIAELTFKSAVTGIKIRKEKLIVVLEQRIYVYEIPELRLRDVIDTPFNYQGVCDITYTTPTILILPEKKKGYVKVINYDEATNNEYKAHDSAIGALTLNKDGKLCATASDKGTIIHIHAIEGLVLLQELRRGVEKAEIQCLAFDKDSQWLACTSDRGTVHIYSLVDSFKIVYEGKEEKKDAKPKFNFMKGISSYFNSQKSFAQLRITDSHSMARFGSENTLTVVTYEGRHYTTELNTKTPGECKKYTKKQFL